MVLFVVFKGKFYERKETDMNREIFFEFFVNKEGLMIFV